ncbi:MAG: SDR family oxidoreductase, partial [Nocardioides sp.]
MKTYVVTGAASGIGAASTALLRDQGHRVITVDLHDADVTADLSTHNGRAEAVEAVQSLTAKLHGVVPCAG